jgi:hypothetical protein
VTQQPTWLTILQSILPVLAVLAGSFLTAWQSRAANEIALRQIKLQIDADLKKAEMQADQEDKNRGLDEIVQRRQVEFEAKNATNQRLIGRLEVLTTAATKLHTAEAEEKKNAYAEVKRYAGTAQVLDFYVEYSNFLGNSADFGLLSELLEKIEDNIIELGKIKT